MKRRHFGMVAAAAALDAAFPGVGVTGLAQAARVVGPGALPPGSKASASVAPLGSDGSSGSSGSSASDGSVGGDLSEAAAEAGRAAPLGAAPAEQEVLSGSRITPSEAGQGVRGVRGVPGSRDALGASLSGHASNLHELGRPNDMNGGSGADFWSVPRSVWMTRPQTGEQIRCTYWRDGQVVRSEYERLCWFMRDARMMDNIERSRRAGRAAPASWYGYAAIDMDLLDVLYALQAWLRWFKIEQSLTLLSGFRHPVTNAATEGAAQMSMHTLGQAADIHITGVSAEQVGKFGVWLGGGGVGFYPGRGFSHFDSGRVRSWGESQRKRRTK